MKDQSWWLLEKSFKTELYFSKEAALEASGNASKEYRIIEVKAVSEMSRNDVEKFLYPEDFK